MKNKILNIYIAVLALAGAAILLINIYYLLNGSGVYWSPERQVQLFSVGGIPMTTTIPGTFALGWADLEYNNKLHVPFLIKAILLILVAVVVWKRSSALAKSEKAARWAYLLSIAAGGAAALAGFALWLSGAQHQFIFHNAALWNLIATAAFFLIGALIVKAALGLFNRDKGSYWMLAGFFIAAVASEIANLLVVVLYPFLISMSASDLLHGWYVRLGLSAVFYLVLFAGSLLLLVWLRSELYEPSGASTQPADQGSVLKLN